MQDASHPASAESEDNGDETLRFRSIWISDIHLGTPGCQAEALLEFLRVSECETLFLVGDIIDGWQLRRSWYWPQAHNDVVQKLLRKVRKGTRVIFVPGNHDEFARKYLGHSFGGVEVAAEWVHQTADGRRFWITHGDLFDGVIQYAKWLAYVGDWAYETTLKLNVVVNRLRAHIGLPYWSLSKYLKLKVKRAVSFIGDYEAAVAREARKRGVDGVICGHIHHAELREHADGTLALVDWSSHARYLQPAVQAAKVPTPAPEGSLLPEPQGLPVLGRLQ